jgi:GAF domain-containing protein/HAMP domain-containing protein
LDGFGLYDNYDGTPVLGVYHWIDNRDIAIVAEMNQQEAFVPAQRVAVTLLLVGLIVGLILALGIFVIARQMTRPVLAISRAAVDVSNGNLNVYAPVLTRDELGVLATTFNQMTEQIRHLVGNLEERVAERTAELRTTTLQSERRANNLQAVSELARIISTEQAVENLLPLITRLVSDRFGYYHVGIFMLDDARRFAVLRAANSEGGQRMLDGGHRLEVGMVGMVGEVAAAGKPRIAHDVGKDAFFFNNPFLPETRSEVALPLRVTGQIMGVLDVQSKEANAFPDDQVEVLTTLADQITIAIQNARSMLETRKLLSEAQTAAGSAVQGYWQVLQSQKQTMGYELSGSVLKPLVNLTELPIKDQTRQDGGSLIFTTVEGKTNLSIPLRLRGQVVGTLNLKIPDVKKWKPDDIDIVNAIAERLSLALETATLMQATQRRAAKEQAISEITSRIGASVNMRNVLQTAVEELGRALPGSEVEIDFKSNNQPEVTP